MTNASARLETIDDTWGDEDVARLIADAMTENEREPYCFVMNHNAGKPEYISCPLRYDFTYGGKWCGMETMFKSDAMTWLAKALVLGYRVSMAGPESRRIPDTQPRKPYGVEYSIAKARDRAALKRRAQSDDPDDDIPF